MTMTLENWNGAALALACGLLTSVAAQAQPDTQPAGTGPAAADAPAPAVTTTNAVPPAASGGSAADALKKQAGDVDQATLLKDTLTKTDRQYSLLRAGRLATNYDFNYSYVGSQAIDVGFAAVTNNIDLLRVETTRAHTITNTLSVDYGLLDNLTLSGTLPFVSKFTQSTEFSGVAHGIGDLSIGARYQPFVQSPSGPTYTLTGSLSLPTGRSPYDEAIGQNISTGSGYASGTLGVNASQVLDPVALFGSLSITAGRSIDNLHQFNKTDLSTLTALRPGKTIGFGAGFTYALSYNVSTSVSFQESVTSSSTITYLDAANVAGSRGTTMQVAAILNFGLGIRLSPKTTINLTAGIGLTSDSPDFSLGLNVPLTFSLF
jgi:hypothetical protein